LIKTSHADNGTWYIEQERLDWATTLTSIHNQYYKRPYAASSATTVFNLVKNCHCRKYEDHRQAVHSQLQLTFCDRHSSGIFGQRCHRIWSFQLNQSGQPYQWMGPGCR
jgi:hypothetical protein